ncbi:MAG: substrate-binding domain-containing protein [Terriglobales bacterium]
MRVTRSRNGAVLLFAIMSVAPCFAHHMAVVVSKQNGVTALSSAQLRRIFRAETKKWPDGKYIQLVLHTASNGEAATLEHLNKMTAQQWHNWIAEHKDALVLVESDDDVLNYVQSAPNAVGLVDVRSLNDHVNIVRIGGKVPMEEGYLPH